WQPFGGHIDRISVAAAHKGDRRGSLCAGRRCTTAKVRGQLAPGRRHWSVADRLQHLGLPWRTARYSSSGRRAGRLGRLRGPVRGGGKDQTKEGEADYGQSNANERASCCLHWYLGAIEPTGGCRARADAADVSYLARPNLRPNPSPSSIGRDEERGEVEKGRDGDGATR